MASRTASAPAQETAGYVEIRVGVGTFVISKEPAKTAVDTAHSVDIGAGPIDILAARKTVEGEIAAIAAITATSDEIDQMEVTLQKILEDSRVEDKENDWPRIFHMQIATATHNPVYIAISDLLWEQTRSPMFDKFRQHTKMRENRPVSQDYRRDLVKCLKRRDADGARLAMHHHINAIVDILSHLNIA